MFDSVQLIPASSGYDHHSAQKDTAHLPAIQRETNIPYTDMIFFDDESPNISKVASVKTCRSTHPMRESLLQDQSSFWHSSCAGCHHVTFGLILVFLQVARLGVTSILVSSGMSVDVLQKGLKQHAANGKSQSRK